MNSEIQLDSNSDHECSDDRKIHWLGLLAFLTSSALTAFFYFQRQPDVPSVPIELAFAISAAVTLSAVLWQACDPFAEAAQWFGDYWRIPGSVRGATLDAIASSMPELFTGLFFVIVAIWGDRTLAERIQHSTDGYGSTIATCAGSAIYNLILIPAVCCLAVASRNWGKGSAGKGQGAVKTELEVETDVLRRDGNWVLVTQFGLLIFLSLPSLHWWMAVVAIVAYFGYAVHLGLATRKHRKKLANDCQEVELGGAGQFESDADEDEDEHEYASILFNFARIRLTPISSIIVLAVCTAVAAAACYFLVEITNELSTVLKVPAFFVSVILVASVSSVPDTLLSVGAARRGDDAGAISNVFGSNIFDICIGMSIPLLVCCYLNDWQPIELVGQNAETMRGVTGLRILLFLMTAIVMFMFWKQKKVTVPMAIFFCFLYLVFVSYAVVGGLGLLPV